MIRKRLCALTIAAFIMCSMSGCGLTELRMVDNTKDKITIDSDSDTTTDSGEAKDLLEDEEISDKLDEIEGYIDRYVYFDTDKEKQEEALYDGIMGGLDDPYSVYYTADEYANLTEETSGEYYGVGAVVTQDENMIVSVVRPIPGSPAEKAGLMAGDVIVEVDGEPVDGEELSLVVERIRGVEGSTAHLKVYREGETDYLDFEIPRGVVQNVTVFSEMLDGYIGYIQVQEFYENTDEEFKEAIEKLKADGARAFIFDMRDNPGGLVTTVVEMCDYIMSKGPIVTTKDKSGKILQSFDASNKHTMDEPMVVLVNGNSASASEIFAGALKDTGKAKLVGTNTFGKGIVQSVIPLSDGTAIKLTIAKYFTPNGNDIHEVGIAPDYEVELPDGRPYAVGIEREDDTQLDKAIELIADMIE